nr:PTS IIA-like nitrogen regulatory protein PtsN [Maricaulis maris]
MAEPGAGRSLRAGLGASSRTMALADLIPNAGVSIDLGASSRKQALQAMSELAAGLTGQASRTIFDAVLQRERLGSTGVGQGVAIPHARLSGVDEVVGVFARLRTPVDFESIDGRPADLIFMLLAPENAGAEHLKALARVSRLLRREDVRQRLRAAPNTDAVHAVLAGEPASDAA